ncbi:MAG: hypothetical protein GY746_10445, partial [Gammaproteobacteria bacterium]|nr:hypothetical protein [Gammaproteobacteria bacterium]
NYQWYRNSVAISGATSETYNVTEVINSPADTISYTADNLTDGCPYVNDCPAIFVDNTPPTTAGSNSPLCVGSDLNLSEGGGEATTWAWTGPNAFTSTDQNPSISSVTTAATGRYYVTITDGSSCQSVDSVDVTINNCPEICDDGIDNDGDGLVDGADPDCCDMLDAGITTSCDDKGTLGDPTDDTYSVYLNPAGNALTSTYSVSGDLTANNVAYGSAQLIGSDIPISAGDLTITITDDANGVCEMIDVNIEAPNTCSDCDLTIDDIIIIPCIAGSYEIEVRVSYSYPADDSITINGHTFPIADPTAGIGNDRATEVFTIEGLPCNE